MTRVAAVDCGTNSIRLLIAEQNGDGTLTELAREMVIVRLGEGVDATGDFKPEAIERTRAALAGFVTQMRDFGVQRVRMVATSATRDAGNREEFFAMTAQLLGQVVPGAVAEVISGDEEAALSFTGAVSGLNPADGPFVVTDLGGGSTELVTADAAYSADVGCVRVTEHSLHDDPPTAAQVDDARAFVAQRLAPAFEGVPVAGARTWVGVAGTLTTLGALDLGLDEYDPVAIHLSRHRLADIERICAELVAAPRETRAALGPMHPGRVDVIAGGALVTAALARELAARAGIEELVVSEHDILDGIAAGLVS
ncbi:putative phosphatase [Gordonia hirsuta DSM 44140 = NBRC 16056]|uniref:Putative phosphatase n=1 Tax=Gordonia hirsuta DSM 44140 = NBRC 16056 TaxID=1121927 RepID=L7LB67_9ACTN|nr:Ppx/GppA phosphatase family protein [Gordonia hirsuta]GAC58380.1 putative phosphatase [Gordonia hirsuta DSM 44140 = NBRC 16056]